MIKVILLIIYSLISVLLYTNMITQRNFVPWWFIPYYKKARKRYNIPGSLILVITTVLFTLPETILVLALAPFVILFMGLSDMFIELFEEKEEDK